MVCRRETYGIPFRLISFLQQKGLTMAFKNLTGFVKMAIADNKNLDKETVDILCQYVDDLKILIDNQDSLIAVFRKDIDGLLREIDTLRAKNNNQAKMIWRNV